MHVVASAISIALMAWLIYIAVRNARADREAQEEVSDFDLLTVSEKVQTVTQTTADLNSIEQLAADLELCSEENQKVIRMDWISDDGNRHVYDLYCNGTNTATDCLKEIAVRESAELRNSLSFQCNNLAMATKGTPLSEKYMTLKEKIRFAMRGE